MPSREAKRWQHHAENKVMRGVRKQVRRNREPDVVRHKDWMPDSVEQLDQFDDMDVPTVERVMPRGEQERRRSVMAQALAALVANEGGNEEAPPVEGSDGIRGVVVEVSSGHVRVDVDGETRICGLHGNLTAQETGMTNVVAVGDDVVIAADGSGGGSVRAVMPRRSALVRPDVFHSHLRQVIAANLDQVLIVASWRDPAVWLELIDRYLIAAARNNLQPVVCLNKVDLAGSTDEYLAVMQPYAECGYRLIYASAHRGDGVDELRAALLGKTSVLAGLSGVGKSSLLNAIEPGLQLSTGDVSGHDHLGRHTTTQVTMRPLRMGGYVVDTPGIRQFGLSGLRRRDLQGFYPEMVPFRGQCRFTDCLHVDEPDCAVRAAVAAGRFPRTRYETYGKVLATLKE
ncbi:MAG: ribosome small subunit-dependent GTPase A [Anaerolineae bacterium]